ncbi:MAG: hypothetical protein ABI461_13055, partial [Polyangiaceae bacterium]
DTYVESLAGTHVVSMKLSIALAVFGLAIFAAAPWIPHARVQLIAGSLALLFAAAIVATRRMGFRQRYERSAVDPNANRAIDSSAHDRDA